MSIRLLIWVVLPKYSYSMKSSLTNTDLTMIMLQNYTQLPAKLKELRFGCHLRNSFLIITILKQNRRNKVEMWSEEGNRRKTVWKIQLSRLVKANKISRNLNQIKPPSYQQASISGQVLPKAERSEKRRKDASFTKECLLRSHWRMRNMAATISRAKQARSFWTTPAFSRTKIYSSSF